MDLAGRDEVGAVLLVVGVQVGLMLEVVGIGCALGHSNVGLDVVAVLDDLEGPTLLLEQRLDGLVQDLCMRSGGGGHGDGALVLCRSRRAAAVAAAANQAQRCDERCRSTQDECPAGDGSELHDSILLDVGVCPVSRIP